MQNLVEIGQVVLEKKKKPRKVNRWVTATFGSGELKMLHRKFLADNKHNMT